MTFRATIILRRSACRKRTRRRCDIVRRCQGGTNLGLRGLLRDSDDFTGWDAETIASKVTNGSAVITSGAANAFVRRAGGDVVTGAGVAADTVVVSHDNDDKSRCPRHGPAQ